MMKPAALLLLLAVAASQVDLSVSQTLVAAGDEDISTCPITYYGRTYNRIQMFFKNKVMMLCFTTITRKSPKDCILISERQDVANISAMVQYETKSPGSTLHQALPNIKSTSTCLVHVAFTSNQGNNTMVFKIHSFGAQAVGKLSVMDASQPNVVVEARVDNSSLGSWTLSPSVKQDIFLDISGCRISDVALAANTTSFEPEICSNVSCSASAVISTVSSCGPNEICHGNNTCGPAPAVCTVTGFTVIGFSGKLQSVRDRCMYSLAKPQGKLDFRLMASFQERRRKDVMFLDHLALWLGGPKVTIYLEQGGRVRVDKQILTLSTTVQLVHGVELSQDWTGVTAKIPFLNTTVSVFFDGYTAHVAAPKTASLDGLCGNPSNPMQQTIPAAAKSISSAAGCDMQYNDSVDATINCNSTTKHCNLMRQAPFTACHNHTDPEPYITACTNTLCKYPAVDGLKCQFLEAYAKACSLQSGLIVRTWRSKADCPVHPQAFCQHRICSAHEFCGKKPSGDTRCFCRAIFASKYRSTNSLGEPTVCMQSSATVNLAGCLMEDKGIDYKKLHLSDESCKGQMDSETHMVTFKFDGTDTCGTVVSTNSKQIIYKNTIMLRNSSASSVITRHDQVEIDFSCFYRKPDVKTVAFRIKDSSVVQKIVSGVFNYSLTMNAYTDPGRTQLIEPTTELILNQKVWLELKTEGLDDKLVSLVTDSCWATNQPIANGSLRYDLIINGCPNAADETVMMAGNGLGTSNYFSFNMFEFSGQNSEIYLHCKLELCIKKDTSCAPTCTKNRRRRSFRSEYASGNQAFISMVWKK